MEDKKKNNLLLKILITALVLVVLVVVGIPFSKYFLISTYTQTTQIKVHTRMPSRIAATEEIIPISFQSIFGSAPRSANQNNSSENNYAVGQVVIPSVGINQPIFVGLTNENMVHGVVNMFPNRTPDKNTLTIIGHHAFYYNGNNGLLFGGVQDLKKEDAVYVRYMNQYYEYKVDSNVLIKDTDVNRVADIGPDYIYLMTCDRVTQTSYRVLVRAKKVDNPIATVKSAFDDSIHRVIQKNKQDYIVWFIVPLILILFIIVVFLIVVWRL